MHELDRRTMMVAGTAAAAGLMASGAFAQEVPKPAERRVQGAEGKVLGTEGRVRGATGTVEARELPGLSGGVKRTSTTKRWYAASFPNMSALVTYVNTPPAQGAGEVVVVGMQQGGAISVLIYF